MRGASSDDQSGFLKEADTWQVYNGQSLMEWRRWAKPLRYRNRLVLSAFSELLNIAEGKKVF